MNVHSVLGCKAPIRFAMSVRPSVFSTVRIYQRDFYSNEFRKILILVTIMKIYNEKLRNLAKTRNTFQTPCLKSQLRVIVVDDIYRHKGDSLTEIISGC